MRSTSISNEIEAAWHIFDHLQYTVGNDRRPFQLASSDDLIETNLARSTWVRRLVQAVNGYEQSVTWFAAWAAYLGWSETDALGPLFAGAIERGATGQEVFDIMTASARGDHPDPEVGIEVEISYVTRK